MKKLLLLAVFTYVFQGLYGQKAPVDTKQFWAVYNGSYKIGERWGFGLEYQFRGSLDLDIYHQTLYRPSLQYFIKPNISVAAGYAFVQTAPSKTGGFFKEHRAWEQLLFAHPVGPFQLNHRLRSEQRWVGTVSDQDNFRNGNRLRYLIQISIPFSKNLERKNIPSCSLSNELFLNFANEKINKNAFDQNRLIIVLGLEYDRHTKFEVGYLNQKINPPNSDNVLNHAVQFAIRQKLDF